MFVDSHCHLDRLDFAPYDQTLDRYLEAAQAARIERMLCVSINLEAYPAMRELVANYASVRVSVGVHPTERDGHEPTVAELETLASDASVVAVGETGLDYFHCKDDLAWQHERFRNHIRAARAVGKPLIVHMRDAKEDTLRILAEEGAEAVGGVMHCYTEDWETAVKAMALNFRISFSGIVTFKSAQVLQDVARKVPEDMFLIETDSPYLAPVPHRGKPNYPHYVTLVAECIANLRGCSVNQVADRSTRNFYNLFPLAV